MKLAQQPKNCRLFVRSSRRYFTTRASLHYQKLFRFLFKCLRLRDKGNFLFLHFGAKKNSLQKFQLLIPTVDVLKVSKEKTAKIIPNAVGISTEDEKHVFGSLLSRDSTYNLMVQVWKAATDPVVELKAPIVSLVLSAHKI